MAKSMIANHVASASQLACNVWPLFHKAANKKKCRLHIVLGEYFQQTKSMRIVGTIVVSQGQLFGLGLQPGERFSIPLATWGHALVARSDSCRSKTCTEDETTRQCHDADRGTRPS